MYLFPVPIDKGELFYILFVNVYNMFLLMSDNIINFVIILQFINYQYVFNNIFPVSVKGIISDYLKEIITPKQIYL